ncbi:hypothetical protein A0J61_11439 [Choanephora cucurbitarum]|uniref:Uncharacterized protein n=1 Tax=Choanephora cucurbitarum TaxID=101091 RepID=A0A1C7MUK9_9FUNG|nr:hypothetical protein A0J61_11439 [Choanephora cucurbitarum]
MACEDNLSSNQRWSPIFQMESVDMFKASLLDQFDKNAYMLNSRLSFCSYDSQEEDTNSSIQDHEKSENSSSVSSPQESIHDDKVKEQDHSTANETLSPPAQHLLHPQKKRGLLHKSSTFFSEKVMGHRQVKVEMEAESNLDTRMTSSPGTVAQELIVVDSVEPKKRAHWLKRLFMRD